MMDGVTISLIGLTVTLLAYLCAGFYWGGRVSAKLDNVAMLLAQLGSDTKERLDRIDAENEKAHKLLWQKHDDLKNRVTVIETKCVEHHR